MAVRHKAVTEAAIQECKWLAVRALQAENECGRKSYGMEVRTVRFTESCS